MVIKPYKDFHQPGIEFSLTYFDDPGITVPSAITAWVAVAGILWNIIICKYLYCISFICCL